MLLRPVVASVLALVAAAGLLVPGTATAGEKPAVDLALMLAVDISGSIDLDEARLQREGYAQAISDPAVIKAIRSEEHTSELQSLMRISYAVFCLKKKKTQ